MGAKRDVLRSPQRCTPSVAVRPGHHNEDQTILCLTKSALLFDIHSGILDVEGLSQAKAGQGVPLDEAFRMD